MAKVPTMIRSTSQKLQTVALYLLTLGLVVLTISEPVYASINDFTVNETRGIALNPVKFTWTWDYDPGTFKLAINDKNQDNPIAWSETKKLYNIEVNKGQNSFEVFLDPGYYGAAIYNADGDRVSNVVKFTVPTCTYTFSPDPANPNETVTVTIKANTTLKREAIYNASIVEADSRDNLVTIHSDGSSPALQQATINLTAPGQPAPSGNKYLVAAFYREDVFSSTSFQCAIQSGDTVLTVTSTPTPTSSPTEALPTIAPPPITQGPKVASICTLNDYFRSVVQILTVIGGFAFFIMTVVGGYKYLTSGGNPQTTAAARNIITFAVIGLILMILAWIILIFVQTLRGGGTPDLRIFNVCPFQ